jgi:tetratricopeptide (TPR) repeat protein
MPGIHTVAGLVFTPKRTPIGRGVSVRLSKGGNDSIAWTNDDGQFSIPGLGNGTYTLTVDAGGDYEQASQRVEIALVRGSPAQTFYVNIQLKLKPGTSAKPAVIDAEMAGVPKKALQSYRNALAAKAKGDTKNAVAELIQAVAEYPDFTAAHSELGLQYQILGNLEQSEEHSRLALKLKPDSYETLGNLGITLVRAKRFAEAETVLRDAIKINSSYPIVYFYLGRSLIGQQKADAAEAEFKTALSVGGEVMNEARRALANIYLQRNENEKALAELQAYLKTNPTPADEKRLQETIQQIRALIKKEDKN